MHDDVLYEITVVGSETGFHDKYKLPNESFQNNLYKMHLFV